MSLPLRPTSLFLLVSLVFACSTEEEPARTDAPAGTAALVDDANVDLPAEVVVEVPSEPVVDMGFVEDKSEEVANRFVDFADKLRRRDFRGARAWIAADFVGDALDGLPEGEVEVLPLDARRVRFDVSTPTVVGRTGFLESIASRLAPWDRVETAVWKVKAAEFQTGFPEWGRIKFKVTLLGSEGSDGSDGPGEPGEARVTGGPRSLVAWAYARVVKEGSAWMLQGFELSSLEELQRGAYLFTDVATSAGVAHSGIRFGKPGNKGFAWNGVAGGDVDGDGLWDLFVPSKQRNFLYLGRTSEERGQVAARFEEEAVARGVAGPAGGTGAVFFDYDNDGDQDLALADVGWEGGGNPLRLYRNDGTGRFEERGAELGFGDRCDGYSLVAFDAEGDGWVDLFVCNYGRVAAEPNNSWIQATNGTPNRYYQNLEGKGFRECAVDRGLVDAYWSYAAAAADFDADGDQDLYVANDYGRNQLWVNDGAGSFREAAGALGVQDLGNGMGVSWGDLDSDGVLDLYVSNMSSTAGNRILGRLEEQDETWQELKKLAAGNTIFLAETSSGDGPAFEPCPPAMGGIGGSWAWSPALVDLDLDGRLDVYCCSGFVTGDTLADT